jgi:HSP20 family molecular chaperone IbpA
MMKKLLFIPMLATLVFGASNDPFEQMDKIFQMQMKQMQQMQKQMDEMFKVMQKSMPATTNMPMITNSGGIMSSGIKDKGDYYEVVLKSGDKGKVDVNVKAKDNMLTITIKESKNIDKNSSYGVIKSFSSSSYMQSFTLPKDADVEKIDYKMKDNKLTVKIPKKK